MIPTKGLDGVIRGPAETRRVGEAPAEPSLGFRSDDGPTAGSRSLPPQGVLRGEEGEDVLGGGAEDDALLNGEVMFDE